MANDSKHNADHGSLISNKSADAAEIKDVPQNDRNTGRDTDLSVQFPTRKRSAIQKFRAALVHRVTAMCLLSVSGLAGIGWRFGWPLPAMLGLGSIFAAMIFLTWRWPQKTVSNGKNANNLQSRFELLEDKAWELRESEERYRSLAEAFSDLMVSRKGNGEIDYCNEAFLDRFSHTGQSLSGQPFSSIPALKDLAGQPLISRTRELLLETTHGPRWFSWLDMPLRDDTSETTGILSVARDVTNYKLAEKAEHEARDRAEQANRAKSRFLATVSHEMRTPLNGILGMSKLLNKTEQTSEQISYTTAISASGKNLLSLIEDMLDLTTIEAGRFVRHDEAFSLREMLNETVELLAQRAHDKQIGLGLYVNRQIPDDLYGDRKRLQQILINLVGNAIKFTRRGGVAIICEVTDAVKMDDEISLSLSVHDSGPGLAKEDQERIFCEFERVENAPASSTEGAGLGLAISNALSRELGGSLKLESTGTTGSHFLLEMPLQLAKRSGDEQADQTFEARVSKAVEKSVLIFSRNQFERMCLRKTIQGLGLNCNSIVSREEMHAFANDPQMRKPNFVLIDPSGIAQTAKERSELVKLARDILGPDGKTAILFPPGKRKEYENYAALGCDHWLILPVREQSLVDLFNHNHRRDAENIHLDINSEFDGEVPQPPRADTPSAVTGKPPIARVLLAEDNDVNALLVTAALERAGITVDRVQNGREAVEKFEASMGAIEEQSGYTAILMDMQMPVMGGMEAIYSIRNLESEAKKAPTDIYVLTADEQEQTAVSASKAGANGLLLKPVDPDRLVETVLDCAHSDIKKVS